MKKEIILAITIGFFILATVLDYLAGPIGLTLPQPFVFFSKLYFDQYPLTAVAVGLRAVAIFLTVSLVFSLIEKNYFLKAAILFVIAVLAVLYSIQQIKTGMRTTSLQWTLSIAHAALLLILTILYNLILGLISGVKEKIKPDEEDEKTYEQ
jgi:hypothetical protein